MKLWLSLCAALVFAAGVAVGTLVSTGCFDATVGPPLNSIVASMVDPDPDYSVYLVSSQEVYQELGLDEQQRRKLEDLFVRHFESVSEVRAGMANVAMNLREGVLAVLSAAQTERFEEIQKRYSEKKIRSYVSRELAKLGPELDLRPEQEPGVFRYLYDSCSARREVYRQRNCRDRSEFRKQMQLIDEKEDRGLQLVLSEEQYISFQKLRERERCMRDRHERKKKRSDCEEEK